MSIIVSSDKAKGTIYGRKKFPGSYFIKIMPLLKFTGNPANKTKSSAIQMENLTYSLSVQKQV